MNLVRKDDEALHGTVPHRFTSTVGKPWEDAVLVGQQQTVDAQVTAKSKAPVVVAQTWVGEP